MNFFEHQDKARGKTKLLVLGFILSVICILFLLGQVYKVVMVMFNFSTFTVNFGPSYYVITENTQLLIFYIFVGLILLSGSLSKYLKFRNGGAAIAKLMNAVPVNRDLPSPGVKQLVDIVDEISIAAGIMAPMIFILPEEKGINAFVAGYNPNDTVLVVTQGALDNLSRDEMQGVIGHEYSHIFNADTALNLRLITILGGLYAIAQLGFSILRARGQKAAGIVFGIMVSVIGLIGVLFGNILRAAISRQRESLADASAVQYTRDPNGITRALLKIEAQGEEALMNNAHAEEINHMCFSLARDISLLSMFASHPKLSTRIARLDPTGEIRAAFMQKPTSPVASPPQPVSKIAQTQAQTMVNAIAASTVLASSNNIVSAIGNPTARSLSHAETILQSFPSELIKMLDTTTGTQALLYAIAINMGRDFSSPSMPISFSNEVQQEILFCINYPQLKNPPYRSALVSLSIPQLKMLSPEDKQTFLKNIYAILEVDLNVPKVILLTILNEHLNADSFKKPVIKYTQSRQIENESVCILWYMTMQTQDNVDVLNAQFTKGMQVLNHKFTGSMADFNFKPHQLIGSLSKLRLLSPGLKQQFISACVSCILNDGSANIYEIELLRAICTCMDCPLPLLNPD